MDFSRPESAFKAIQSGRLVAIVDDVDRENEVDLVLGAEFATKEALAFMIRHTSGIICVPMPTLRADVLNLPPMTSENTDPRNTAFTVSVDATHGGTTGISACDRARTIRLLADPESTATDLRRPGHVFPLRSKDGGVLVRPGHTEAAVDLARLSGVQPVAAIAELTNPDGTMARLADAFRFTEQHELPIVSVAQIAGCRLQSERLVERLSQARLPTGQGEFMAYGYRSLIDGAEHLVLLREPVDRSKPVLVRVQSECLTGEVFGSTRCDCRQQLHASLVKIAGRGSGALIYLLGHEGRGIGLVNKLRAYGLQDEGLDTVDANLALGFPVDERRYWIAARILADLNITKIQLMTNNPDKIRQLEDAGVGVVERIPILTSVEKESANYMESKRQRLGHLVPSPTKGGLSEASELARPFPGNALSVARVASKSGSRFCPLPIRSRFE